MLTREKFAMGVAEVLGTGVLTLIVLAVSRSPIGIPYFVALGVGLAMALMVLVVGSTSGAHLNPAVTLGLWSARKVSTIKAILYIGLQFVGAALAWKSFTYLTNNSLQNIAGADFDWRVFAAEAIGAFVFTFGLASAVYQKYTGGKLAATIGGSLTLGILVASTASNGLINPAIALGVNSWSITYAVAPLVGGIIGVNLYALLFAGEVLVPNQSVKKAIAGSSKKTTAKKATKKPSKARRK